MGSLQQNRKHCETGLITPTRAVPQPSPHLPHSFTLISSGSGLSLLLDCYVHTDAAIKHHQCPQSPHNPSLFDLERHRASQSPLHCALWLLLWFTTVGDQAHETWDAQKLLKTKNKATSEGPSTVWLEPQTGLTYYKKNSCVYHSLYDKTVVSLKWVSTATVPPQRAPA